MKMTSLFDLFGKTALVTGGTRGIGHAMVIGLAEAGADIILAQRDSTNTKTQEEIRSLGRQCEIIECDLSATASVSALIPSLLGQLSPPVKLSLPDKSQNSTGVVGPDKISIPNNDIHIFLSVAGINSPSPSHQYPLDAYNKIIQTNLTSPFQLSRDLGNYWISHCPESTWKARSIIHTASILSYQGGFMVPAYSASKGGIAQIVKAFSNEWASKGIRVNGVAPGYIATDMTAALASDPVRGRQITERTPAGRWGTPEDLKGVVVWLASEKAAGFVSGEIVTVDGGWMGW